MSSIQPTMQVERAEAELDSINADSAYRPLSPTDSYSQDRRRAVARQRYNFRRSRQLRLPRIAPDGAVDTR